MKKYSLIILFGIFTITNLFAQNKKFGAELSEIRKQKNHLDLDIKNIFRGIGNASILYKRTFQTGDLIDVKAIKLIRFSGSFNNQITFTDDPTRSDMDTTDLVFHPSNLYNINFGIGFEKQVMNKKFVHYFGIDGIFNFFKTDDDYTNGQFGGINNNSVNSTDRLIQTFRTGINPFFGVKYYFTDRISIGIETGLSILYFRQKITEVEFENATVGGVQFTNFIKNAPFKSNGIQTNFNNLRFLTIGYTF